MDPLTRLTIELLQTDASEYVLKQLEGRALFDGQTDSKGVRHSFSALLSKINHKETQTLTTEQLNLIQNVIYQLVQAWVVQKEQKFVKKQIACHLPASHNCASSIFQQMKDPSDQKKLLPISAKVFKKEDKTPTVILFNDDEFNAKNIHGLTKFYSDRGIVIKFFNDGNIQQMKKSAEKYIKEVSKDQIIFQKNSSRSTLAVEMADKYPTTFLVDPNQNFTLISNKIRKIAQQLTNLAFCRVKEAYKQENKWIYSEIPAQILAVQLQFNPCAYKPISQLHDEYTPWYNVKEKIRAFECSLVDIGLCKFK